MGKVILPKEMQELKEKYHKILLEEYEKEKSRYESLDHFLELKMFNLTQNESYEPEDVSRQFIKDLEEIIQKRLNLPKSED